MNRIDTDILVVGGGVAGLTATAVLARDGFAVTCVDPVPPVTEEGAPGADLRTTAFLSPALALLQQAGIWQRLAPHAAALRIMRLVDASQPDRRPQVADFSAAELGAEAFGHNLPNWLIRRELLGALEGLPNARLMAPARASAIVSRSGGAIVTLACGTQVQARLVIAADGRDSAMRAALGIAAHTWRYGQKALVLAVRHDTPHDNISTEVHMGGGPFTLVPMVDPHLSAVVWMERGPQAHALIALDDAALGLAATARSANMLGTLRIVGGRALWPIIARRAASLYGPRTALLAEAAHVIPPIGAQGLNMSLADLACLRELLLRARDTGSDIGAPDLLRRYHTRRWPDIAARIAGVDLLNRAAMTRNPVLQAVRRGGLGLLHGTRALRLAAMRAGLGVGTAAGKDSG